MLAAEHVNSESTVLINGCTRSH